MLGIAPSIAPPHKGGGGGRGRDVGRETVARQHVVARHHVAWHAAVARHHVVVARHHIAVKEAGGLGGHGSD